MTPPLSIIIPSRSRPDLLRNCLRSVLRFAPAETEVLVIDDASANESVRRTAEEFGTVRVLRLRRPSGFCLAVNLGIAHAQAAIIELLNDDTEVTAGWADAALACFADASITAVAPLVLLGSPHLGVPRIDSAGDEYDYGGFARKRGHGCVVDATFEQPCEVFGVSGAAGFYRREALVHLGGLPNDFGAYFEDVDLACRIRRAGGRVRYEPRSRVWHIGSASYGRRPSRRVLEQQSCNEERVFWRNLTRPKHALPRHAAVLLGKAWRRLGEGTFLPWFLGRLRGLAVSCRLRSREDREEILTQRRRDTEREERKDI